MAGSEPLVPLQTPDRPTGAAEFGHKGVPSAGRVRRLTGRDRLTIVFMLAVPLFLTITLVVLPAIATVVLSFTNWNGIGDLSTIKWIGLKTPPAAPTISPPFWPAIRHNILWLAVLFLVATPFGMFLGV